MPQYTSISSLNCDSHEDFMAKLNAAGREGYHVIHAVTFYKPEVSHRECFPEVTFYLERTTPSPR